jgi:predicted SnoaL-like aldol condensation-catalyzing enzyme
MKTPLLTALACLLALVAAPVVGVAAETPQEAANKQLVLDFYRDIEATMAAGKPGEMPKVDAKYIDPGYIQHGVHGQGVPGAQGGGGAPPKMGPPTLLSIMAEGDKVIQVTSRSITNSEGKPERTIIFNMFRVKDGKLIEHWDAFGVPAESAANAPAPK